MLPSRSSKENYNPRPHSIATTATGRPALQQKGSKMSPPSDTGVDLLPFLRNLRIEPSLACTYSKKMQENGFDDVPSLEFATEEDLESIGIKIGHARRIARSVVLLKEGNSQSTAIFFSPSSSNSSPQQDSGAALDMFAVQGNGLSKRLSSSKLQAGTVGQLVKRLTPEERLEAHRLRKLAEIRHKKQEGKWERPPSLEESRLTEKVQSDDELVHRLSATSMERKVIDNVQKNLKKYKQVSSGSRNSLSASRRESKGTEPQRTSPDIRSEIGQKSTSKKHKKKKKKKGSTSQNTTAADKHTALMNRLAMPMKQRRKDGGIPVEVKRALRGHHLEKQQWSMADAFADIPDLEFEDEFSPEHFNRKHHASSQRDITNDNQSPVQVTKKHHASSQRDATNNNQSLVQITKKYHAISQRDATNNNQDVYRCQTCNSATDCEEDVDDPGTFYCQQCWEDFEGSLISDSQTPPDSKSLLKGFKPNLPPHKVVTRKINRHNPPEEYKLYDDEDDQGRLGASRLVPRIQAITRSPSRGNLLWIVHDNPKLGSKVSITGNAVKCWIETKDPYIKNCFRVITGSIEYSGSSAAEAFNGSETNERIQGDQCFRVNNLAAFIVNHETVQTKLSKGGTIVEFQLGDDCRAELTSLKEFFVGCLGSVDVILDPQVSTGNWYPQREADTVGFTKVAPQFRSKGVGYLRLGDDMGKNGLAFLSDDGCKTFFIGPAENSPKAKRINNTLARENSPKAKRTNNTLARPVVIKKMNTRDEDISKRTRSTPRVVESESEEEDSDSDESDDEDSEDESSTYSLDEIIRRLQDNETVIKWSEKAKLVNRLGKLFVREYNKGANVNTNDVLLVIQTIMASKNLNANIVRNAVLLLGQVGECLGKEMFSSAFCKIIFVEAFKLLKNKQVSGTVKETLARMHGQCFTLSHLTSTIGQTLGVGRATSARNAKKIPLTKSNSKVDSSLSTVEVIEWLNTTIQAERTMDNPLPALDENSLVIIAGYFLGEVAHRDQRCRQNVFEGLANVIAYGIQQLGMKVDSALKLCYALNHINPKAWKMVVEIMEGMVYKR